MPADHFQPAHEWVSAAAVLGGLVVGLLLARLLPLRDTTSLKANLWGLGYGCLLPSIMFVIAAQIFGMSIYHRGGWDNVFAALAAMLTVLATMAGLFGGFFLRRRSD
jgi:uncharacterized membrane protein